LLRTSEPTEVVLDAREVSYSDSGAYRDIIAFLQEAERLGARTVLLPGPALRRLAALRGERLREEGGLMAEGSGPVDKFKETGDQTPSPAEGAERTAPFEVDLDFERRCIEAELGEVPEPGMGGPLEFRPLKEQSSGKKTEERKKEKAFPVVFLPEDDALRCPVEPAHNEEPEQPEAQPAPPDSEKPSEYSENSFLREALRAVAENKELRSAREHLTDKLAQSEARSEKLAAELKRLKERWHLCEPFTALSPLRETLTEWQAIEESLAELVFMVRTGAALPTGHVRRALRKVAALADQGPLAAYGPVFPPQKDSARVEAVLGLCAALACEAGFDPAARSEILFTAFMSELCVPVDGEPHQVEAFCTYLAGVWNAVFPESRTEKEQIEKRLHFVRPVRKLVELVSEGADPASALNETARLAEKRELRSVSLLRKTLGMWPRGTSLRLSDGTIAQVIGPVPGGILLSVCAIERDGEVLPVPPLPILVREPFGGDVVGVVRLPCEVKEKRKRFKEFVS